MWICTILFTLCIQISITDIKYNLILIILSWQRQHLLLFNKSFTIELIVLQSAKDVMQLALGHSPCHNVFAGNPLVLIYAGLFGTLNKLKHSFIKNPKSTKGPIFLHFLTWDELDFLNVLLQASSVQVNRDRSDKIQWPVNKHPLSPLQRKQCKGHTQWWWTG